jgi:aspartyl-tRNA(Asn)/glutamyl-tRNA(Gln) amidotransferase subunit B
VSWEVVIGIETHAQLRTQSKIFSGAATDFGAAPNTQACAVDIALPGVLPVLNRAAVEHAIRFGLAIGATLSRRSVFARKNYFYPDLPKGYQISQYELPIVQGGSLPIHTESGTKTIRITRAHLEEDAGKSLHEDFHGMSGIDLNRAGTPLLEIVSEPDLRGAREAVTYARALHALVTWIGICDGNMQEGSFRCDVNVSVRRPGEPLGTRREIKNLNSFKFIQQAIDYEVQWQIDTIENGGKIHQATVLFDPDKGETHAMRSKEEAHDYRYFPDPDLLPLDISEEWKSQVRMSLPELPQAKRERYTGEYALTAYDAGILTATRETADYFEALLNFVPGQAKICANWLIGEVSAQLNRDGLEMVHCPITPQQLGGMLKRISDGTISNAGAKEVFRAMWSEGGDADAIIENKGLKQVSDTGAIEKIVDQIIAANPAQVAEYRSGKEKVFGFFVGLAMKASKGKANPAQLNEVLKRKLS